MTLPILVLIVLLLPEMVGMIAAATISAGALLRGLLSRRLVVSRLAFRFLVIALWVAAGFLRFDWGASLGVLLYAVSAMATMGLLLTWTVYRPSEFLTAIRAIQAVAILEALVVLYKWVRLWLTLSPSSHWWHPMGYPRPDDWASGITGGAHDAGMLFVFAMAVHGGNYLASRGMSHLLYSLFFGGMLYLTATHQALVAVFFSIGIVLVVVGRKKVFLSLLVMLLFILVAPTIYFVGDQLAKRGTDVPKVRGYARTLTMYLDNPGAAITGVGAGNYGSRAAVARSDPNDLFKDSSRIPRVLVGTPPPLKKYLADLYDAKYFRTLGDWGTYYTPFSTWNAVLGEQGLIGLILLMVLWFKILRTSFIVLRSQMSSSTMPAFVTAVVGIGLMALFTYDNWLEYPKLMVPFYISAAYTYKLYREGDRAPSTRVVPG